MSGTQHPFRALRTRVEYRPMNDTVKDDSGETRVVKRAPFGWSDSVLSQVSSGANLIISYSFSRSYTFLPEVVSPTCTHEVTDLEQDVLPFSILAGAFLRFPPELVIISLASEEIYQLRVWRGGEARVITDCDEASLIYAFRRLFDCSKFDEFRLLAFDADDALYTDLQFGDSEHCYESEEAREVLRSALNESCNCNVDMPHTMSFPIAVKKFHLILSDMFAEDSFVFANPVLYTSDGIVMSIPDTFLEIIIRPHWQFAINILSWKEALELRNDLSEPLCANTPGGVAQEDDIPDEEAGAAAPEEAALSQPVLITFDESESESESGDDESRLIPVDFKLSPHNQRDCVYLSELSSVIANQVYPEVICKRKTEEVLTWQVLNPVDRRILEKFVKHDHSQNLVYAHTKKLVVEGVTSWTVHQTGSEGIRNLSPAVRACVMVDGVVCIDFENVNGSIATFIENASGIHNFKNTKNRLTQSISRFLRSAASAGVVDPAVRLVSVCPEGFLVRGFFKDPDVSRIFPSLVANVKRDTGVEVVPIVVELKASDLAETPYTGDYAIYTKTDLSAFDTPSHRALLSYMSSGNVHPRAILWAYEEKGNWGKSVFTRYAAERGACCISCDVATNVFHAVKSHMERCPTTRLIILDMPRCMVSGSALSSLAEIVEKIKNGNLYSGKYQSGTKLFNAVHIVIFANEEPGLEFKNALSADRLRVVNLRTTPVVDNKFALRLSECPGVSDDDSFKGVL